MLHAVTAEGGGACVSITCHCIHVSSMSGALLCGSSEHSFSYEEKERGEGKGEEGSGGKE